MIERDNFGPALRRERERRGITLQAIAEATKISAAHFAAMERNDFSRWPGGIFRRSFLRAYANAVGLDADRTVEQYLRLFPQADDHHDGAARKAAAKEPEQPATVRSRRRWGRAAAAHLVARLMALCTGVVRIFSRRAAPPAAATSARHVTKRRSVQPHETGRRHRPRRSDRSRPRA